MSIAPYNPVVKPPPRVKKPRTGLKRSPFKSNWDRSAIARVHAWNAKKRKPVRKISAKKRAEMILLAKIRREKIAVVGDICQLRVSPQCRGYSEGLNHKKKKGQGGEHTHANTDLSCNPCNGWVEDHPEEARKLGFVITRKDAA